MNTQRFGAAGFPDYQGKPCERNSWWVLMTRTVLSKATIKKRKEIQHIPGEEE